MPQSICRLKLKRSDLGRIHSLLELGGSGRSLPIEGLRGIAVSLVFLDHYCTQFVSYANVSGFTRQVARASQDFGEYGVELFFVLSGFLIYSILLRRRPSFIPFMTRRAQRLYPAFIIALLIGILADLFRPEARIPPDLTDGAIYLVANILFLPGLLPIIPLFIVNWSLSYEWWFYATATFLFSVCRLSMLPPWRRITVIIAASAILLGLSACGVPYVPVRGLVLFGGMLLAEANIHHWRPPHAVWGICAAIASLVLCLSVPLAPWLGALVITLGFCFLCSGAFATIRLFRSPCHVNISGGLGICLIPIISCMDLQ